MKENAIPKQLEHYLINDAYWELVNKSILSGDIKSGALDKINSVAQDVLLFMNSTHRFSVSMYGKKESEKLNENSKPLPKEIEFFDHASGKLNLRSY